MRCGSRRGKIAGIFAAAASCTRPPAPAQYSAGGARTGLSGMRKWLLVTLTLVTPVATRRYGRWRRAAGGPCGAAFFFSFFFRRRVARGVVAAALLRALAAEVQRIPYALHRL